MPFPVIEFFMETQTHFTIKSTLGDLEKERIFWLATFIACFTLSLHKRNRCIWSHGLKHGYGGFFQ